MESVPLLDCAGRRRSPATLPGYHRGRPPRNKGLRYPADPPTVEEIIVVMRQRCSNNSPIRVPAELVCSTAGASLSDVIRPSRVVRRLGDAPGEAAARGHDERRSPVVAARTSRARRYSA